MGHGSAPGHPAELVPLGPVLVFAASNFPFAFSVVGGDTASALAAGCPVVVKAHPGHPRLSDLVGAIVRDAAEGAGGPDGLLAVVHGVEEGRTALVDPRIKACGFTGSAAVGRALFDLANGRNDPIPFSGELGSLNPPSSPRAPPRPARTPSSPGSSPRSPSARASSARSRGCSWFRPARPSRTSSPRRPFSGPRRCSTTAYSGAELLAELSERAGRVIWNGWPTGCHRLLCTAARRAPPATTAAGSTSVGTAAIARFLRPVTYQDIPQELLPPELRDGAAEVPRSVDGRMVLP